MIGPEGVDVATDKETGILDVHLSCLDAAYGKVNTVFQRVVKDRTVTFGDGGDTDQHFPVFVCPEVRFREVGELSTNNVHETTEQLSDESSTNDDDTCSSLPTLSPRGNQRMREELNKEFSRLAAQRNDIQQNGIVEDIVDPELFGQLLHPENATTKNNDPSKKITKAEAEGNLHLFQSESTDDEKDDNNNTDLLSRTYLKDSARGQYAWIPSLVEYDKKRQECKFLSPIQNLPRTKTNRKLYSLLEESLSQFMPTFIKECGAEKCAGGAIPRSSRSRWKETGDKEWYKVCVKIQRYKIPPKAQYKGQWHTEGVHEQVSAVGVLYVDWPEELEGGALKFKPIRNPAEHYLDSKYWGDAAPILATRIHAEEGTGIAFRNSIPHRFCALKNLSESKVAVRSFVNFFVTKPTLTSTKHIPTNADIYLCLIKLVNHDIVGEVLTWLQLTPTSFSAAKTLRYQAKAEMVTTKGKWGSYDYGNCGQVEYLSFGGPTEKAQKLARELRDHESSNPDPERLAANTYYMHGGSFLRSIRHRLTKDQIETLGPYYLNQQQVGGKEDQPSALMSELYPAKSGDEEQEGGGEKSILVTAAATLRIENLADDVDQADNILSHPESNSSCCRALSLEEV